jgi:hypothetical protein
MFTGNGESEDEGVEVSESSESDETSLSGTEILPPRVPEELVNNQATPEPLQEMVQEEVEKKRKFCGCDHDDLFGVSYSKLDIRSYFLANYMNERPNPVHYCTAIKENGEKCGLDFTNPALEINTTNPVRACKMALMLETECVHAMCTDCYSIACRNQLGQGRGRSSRRRQNTAVDENATGIVGV